MTPAKTLSVNQIPFTDLGMQAHSYSPDRQGRLNPLSGVREIGVGFSNFNMEKGVICNAFEKVLCRP